MHACPQVGTVRGEDYDFQFSGRVREGKLHFRLNMEYCGDDDDDDQPPREPPDPRQPRCVRAAASALRELVPSVRG